MMLTVLIVAALIVILAGYPVICVWMLIRIKRCEDKAREQHEINLSILKAIDDQVKLDESFESTIRKLCDAMATVRNVK